MTSSRLDEIPGLGPTRRKALIDKFGSIAAISAASVAELQEVHGIGRKAAENIADALSTNSPAVRGKMKDLDAAAAAMADEDTDAAAPGGAPKES